MGRRKNMYLSELFLKSLNGNYNTSTALIALEVCNKELRKQMIGIEDKMERIRYFFCTDKKGEIVEPNARYLELMDFWDVYQDFDKEIPYEIKQNMWILQMIYEADSRRVFWEKERRKQEMTQVQCNSLNMICREFEEKIGKKELVILLEERTGLQVWERIEMKGFNGKEPVPERDFAENELMKLFQSGGIAVLVVECEGVTPQQFYGYRVSNYGCEKLDQKEANRIQQKVLQEEFPLAQVRGRLKGNSGIYVENPYIIRR